MWTVQYETLRQQIDSDYEETVRSLLPGLYPRAQVCAGMADEHARRSGSRRPLSNR